MCSHSKSGAFARLDSLDMNSGPTSKRLDDLMPLVSQLFEFATQSAYARRQGDAAICDFVFGNPHELALPSFVQALQRAVSPREPNWYAYTMTDPTAAKTVADSLRRRLGLDVDPADVFMTNGAFTGIAVILQAILDSGDEVLFNSP